MKKIKTMKKTVLILIFFLFAGSVFSQQTTPKKSGYYFFQTQSFDLFDKVTKKTIPQNSIYVLYYGYSNTAFVYMNKKTIHVGDSLFRQDRSVEQFQFGKVPNYYKYLSHYHMIIDSTFTGQ